MLSLVVATARSRGPAAGPVTIIAIGDSLTERVGANTDRGRLDRMLRDAGIEVDRDREAVSGAIDPPRG